MRGFLDVGCRAFERYQALRKGAMSNKKTTPERLAAFSDGVVSVIITIMVLEKMHC
jgi:hypothetical protein